ncbi:zinc-binding dehydrogenase [Pseudonocardia sp. N23]|uniref:zinc-binding dehydrogenase n=1 Tax=Pseudonocardia sp. N23 TaxID=1987376 RepID=UPI000BFBC6A9|nr:zinc-binding dehydrogenase [Pseudonocardia sp. N23]GAY08611.1 S-nitrosomycothiol reductase MscR [Pseudonocardia sp. N23]
MAIGYDMGASVAMNSVAVIGVDDAAFAGANLAGVTTIIAGDLDRARLEKVKGFGTTDTFNSRGVDPSSDQGAPWRPTAPTLVIDAVGRLNPPNGVYARDPASTAVLFGVPTPEMEFEVPMIDIFGRGGARRWSWYGDGLPSRDSPAYIDQCPQGWLPLDEFVSEEINLDVVESFYRMERDESLRSVVVI